MLKKKNFNKKRGILSNFGELIYCVEKITHTKILLGGNIKMNKAELIAAIAAKTGETKKSAEETLNAFVSVVTDQLTKGDKVQLVGFGSF